MSLFLRPVTLPALALAIAISNVLAQSPDDVNSGAYPLCQAPALDNKLGLNIPCARYQDSLLSARLVLAGQEENYFWEVGAVDALHCKPNLAACATRIGNDLSLNLSGVNIFGVPHALHLKFNGQGWIAPSFAATPAATAGIAAVKEALGSVAFNGGKTLDLDVGIGSGAFHMPGDDPTIIYTVTDRGPNIACEESAAVIEIADFCKDNGVLDNAGKIFPDKAFAPSIYKLKVAGTGYTVLQRIVLKDRNGNPITGLSNPLTVTDTENAYTPDGSKLALDPQGLDTEALVRLSDGTFWLAEEYGPSLVHVAADGQIIERVVPAGMESDLAAANYSVSGTLPAILKKRKLNRGAESIAVSPNEDYLYFAMQSPLANPNNDAYKASKNVRLLKLKLDGGAISRVEGEYVYVMDVPQTFPLDKSSKQSDVKVSEMFALDTDDLVILERISKDTKLYRVTLNAATNLLGTAWDSEATAPSLENTGNLAAANIVPVTKNRVFNAVTDMVGLADKIEGVALLDDTHMALINDNDFGITGEKTEINVAKLYQQIYGDAPATQGREVKLTKLGSYASGQFMTSAAEIVAYCAMTKRIFVVNAQARMVDVLDASDPENLKKVATIDATALGNTANSVAAKNGIVAVAIENADKQANGLVAFYDASSLQLIRQATVGALPDMLTFTPDGSKVLVANEGEPNDDYSNDPEGSVSIIDVATGAVQNATFSHLNKADLLSIGVRIFGKNASAAQDLEPEYITVAPDGQFAMVSLQENNALAIIDINNASVIGIYPLNYKDHSKASNMLEASNKDGSTKNLANWPVWGMYQPDSIGSYLAKDGNFYVVSANEGDSRDYGGYSEEARVADLSLDPIAFPNAADLKGSKKLGRLKVTTANGDLDGDGDYDKLYAFGGRSFSIWGADGQVFDSGDDFETVTSNLLGAHFNADVNNDDPANPTFDSDGRSDDKGPEPEALAIGEINGETYAFIGLERANGIMVYNISEPRKAFFVTYINHVDYSKSPLQAGDLAPEGMAFVPAANSPNGKPLLIIGHEVSGTTAVYQIDGL